MSGHEPGSDELQLMKARGFYFNGMGAYQMNLANDWAIIIGPHPRKRGGIFWSARLGQRSIVRQQFGGYSCPIDTADLALARWRTYVQAQPAR